MSQDKIYQKLMTAPKDNNQFILAGVLTGISRTYGLPPLLVKILFGFFALSTSIIGGLILYLIAYYFMEKYNPKYDLSKNTEMNSNYNKSEPDIIIKKSNKVIKEKEE